MSIPPSGTPRGAGRTPDPSRPASAAQPGPSVPNLRGAVDLSSLGGPGAARPGQRPTGGPAGAPGAHAGQQSGTPSAGAYVLDLDEASFRDAMAQSMQCAVLIEFWSSATGSPTQALADAVNAAEGRFLLGRLDLGANPQLAAAVGVPTDQLPLVAAVLRGQLMPLFSGPVSSAQLGGVLDQVSQAAVANGITGRAQPVGAADEGSENTADEPAQPDERVVALARLAQTDIEAAIAECEKLLAQSPADEQLQLLLASMRLQRRLAGAPDDVVSQADADPVDVNLQILAAGTDFTDPELADGDVRAYDRLLAAMRRSAGDDRDEVRGALLQLFEIAGTHDPNVVKARKQLTALMF